MSSPPLTPEPPRPRGENLQDIPQLRLDDPGPGPSEQVQVLEATAAPQHRAFSRPRRGGRGRTAGRSPSSGSSAGSASGSARTSSESGLLSPTQGASRESSPAPGPAPVPARILGLSPSLSASASSSRAGSPSPAGSSLSSRAQSMLRAPRMFSDDEEDALMAVGVGQVAESTDAFLDRFAEIQRENEESSRRYEEELRSLRQELKKLDVRAEEQNSWIEHVETRAQEMEGRNEALEKENAILVAQLGVKEKEVKGLRSDVRMMEEIEKRVVVVDEGGEGEGRVELTPGEANSRIRRLREEIAGLKEGIRELKEERDRHGDELEMLWERKEQAEVVEKENVELKREVERVRTEYVVLERQLVIEREATKKYEEPAEEKLARVKESPVLEVFGSPGSPPGAKGSEAEGGVVVDAEVTARMEKLAEMIEDMKIKHEKEIENLELKIIEANYNIKVKEEEAGILEGEIQEANDTIKTKDVEIKKLHDAAAGVVAQFNQLQEKTARYKEQTDELKARQEAQINELNQQIAGLQEQLQAKETELAHEKERHEAREKIRESNERDLRAQLAQLEQSDQKDVENLVRDLQEREEEIGMLERKNEKLQDRNDELHKNVQHLQRTVRNYRKGGADLPIRQTIANTQLWAEKNILRDSLENIKNRISKIDPSEVERIQPLKAIFDELKQTKDRLKKEKEDWAKEDGEITAILRRIDGRNSQEQKHTPRISRRPSLLPSTRTEFLKKIEHLEQEQNAYITSRHEEFTTMNAERPLGGPLTAEEEERLQKMIREFVDKLPDNPMVAFLGGDTPQARRKNQLYALTEKVKRLKIRKGQDIHTWLPKLKPTVMEHKRRHAQLMKELHVLEGDAEDIIQQINELTQSPPEWEERGRSAGKLPEEEEEEEEEKLRKKEEDLRREIRFAYSRLERLLYNRQLFEHWVDTLEKRLHDEASSLVTQVLLEFELRHLLDKESKEACFCHLFEYFFPKAYDSTVVGEGHGHGHSSSPDKGDKGKEKEGQSGGKSKSSGPKPGAQPSSASLSGQPRNADAELRGSRSHRGKRIPRDTSKTAGKQPVGFQEEDDDDEVIVRSRAPARLVRGESFGGRSATFPPSDPLEETDDEPSTSPSPKKHPHPRHGHGGGHLSLSISPESAKFFREHAYPYICQVLTSLIWFGLLLAIQPRNMLKTLSFMLSFVVGLPVYFVQFSRFYLAEHGGLSSLSPGFVSRFEAVVRSLGVGKGGDNKPTERSRTEYVDIFEGQQPLAGTSGLGIVLPKSQEVEAEVLKEIPQPAPAPVPSASPELQLRGGGGKRARKSRYKMKKGLTVPEDPEPGSGSEQQQEAEAEPSPVEEDNGKRSPAEEGKLVPEEVALPAAEPEPTIEETGEPLVEEELLTPTPLQISPELPPSMTTSEFEPKGKGKEKETYAEEVAEEIVVPTYASGEEAEPAIRFYGFGRLGGLSYPEESPPGLHPWRSLSGFPTRREIESESQDKGKGTEEEPLFSLSPTPSSPRRKRTSSQELEWSGAEWLAQAEARKQEEEALKKQQRSQKWWWRLWFWIADLWVSFVQFVSAYRPFSSWTSFRKEEEILPAPPVQPTEGGVSGKDSPPPLRWNRTPRWARSSVFPGVRPLRSTTTPSLKFPREQPAPKPSYQVVIRNFVETYIVQNIMRSLSAIRTVFTTAIVILASLISRLANFLQQVLSSTIIFLRTAISIPINLSQNLWARLQAPNLKPPYHIPKINLRLSQIRPPNINLHLPKIKGNLPDLNLSLARRKNQAKANFNRFRPRLHLPKFDLPKIDLNPQELKTLPKQIQLHLPKITPPRPPSPPTILGSLFSFFLIYTILTYLACLAERRVWASQNITWKHAYLRDLELSRIAAAQQSPSSFIKSVFVSSSSSAPKTGIDVGNSAYPYPGWSPAKVDYRLLYAPAFWNLWYLPGDLGSWAGERVRPAWEVVKGGGEGVYKRVLGGRLDWIGEGITESWGRVGEGIRDFAERRKRDYEDSLERLWRSFSAVGGALSNVWEKVRGVGVAVVDGIGTGLRGTWRALTGRLFDGWRVPNWGTQIKEKISKLLGSIRSGWNNILRPFKVVWGWIRDVIESCWKKIFAAGEYVKAVWSWVKQVWREMTRPAREAREWVRETIRGWWKKIFEGEYTFIKGSEHLGKVWVPSRLAAAWSGVRGG